ncbi:hypothetical protein JGU71_12955 [Antrihabitans sp. YC3-6]|uniref:Uncharacterized protein n=1 Tax=Antrihabitans stalagmiti TaxID=2799499 RepID=A0A934U3U2_9NOCA|nr:hypothetical protein [Antrihabitans stalagmiti]MBJ8339797.1 hypothetical protein [Antrihabitans stalagmiti]
MTRRAALIASESVVVVLCVVAVFLCWGQGVRTSDFGPALEGAPPYSGTYYSGSWLTLAVLLVLIAGVLTIDCVRRVLGREET